MQWYCLCRSFAICAIYLLGHQVRGRRVCDLYVCQSKLNGVSTSCNVRGVNNLLVPNRNIILKSVLCTLFSKELLPTSKVLYNMILIMQTLAEGICKPIDNALGVEFNNQTYERWNLSIYNRLLYLQ
jgi:hypothetical protein